MLEVLVEAVAHTQLEQLEDLEQLIKEKMVEMEKVEDQPISDLVEVAVVLLLMVRMHKTLMLELVEMDYLLP